MEERYSRLLSFLDLCIGEGLLFLSSHYDTFKIDGVAFTNLIYSLTLIALIAHAVILYGQQQIQRKETKWAEYRQCEADFTDVTRAFIPAERHVDVYNEFSSHSPCGAPERWNQYEREKIAYGYCELLYELFERVWAEKSGPFCFGVRE